MRRLRMTFYARDAEVHPIHTLFVEREYVDAARMIHWNDAGETLTHVFLVDGEQTAFAEDLTDAAEVLEYDLTPIADDRFYAYVRAETTPVQREMFDAYDSGGIVVTSPLEHIDGGGVSFEVVGEPAVLQAALDGTPDGIRVEVEQVGGSTDAPESVLGALSERQREAAQTAVAVGYYDVPRTASHEDVASELECAPSTASEHLRKAESKVLQGLFRGK